MKKQIFAATTFFTLALCSSAIAMQSQQEKSIPILMIKGFQGFFKKMDNCYKPIVVISNEQDFKLCTWEYIFCIDKNFPCKPPEKILSYETIYDFSSTYKQLKQMANVEEFSINHSNLYELQRLIREYKYRSDDDQALEPFASRILYPGDNIKINFNE